MLSEIRKAGKIKSLEMLVYKGSKYFTFQFDPVTKKKLICVCDKFCKFQR